MSKKDEIISKIKGLPLKAKIIAGAVVAVLLIVITAVSVGGGKVVFDELTEGAMLSFTTRRVMLQPKYNSSKDIVGQYLDLKLEDDRGMTYVVPTELKNGTKISEVHLEFDHREIRPKNNKVVFKEGIEKVRIEDIYGAGICNFPKSCKEVSLVYFGGNYFNKKNKFPKTVEKLTIDNIWGKNAYGKLQTVTIPDVKEIIISLPIDVYAENFKFQNPNQIITVQYHSNSDDWTVYYESDEEAIKAIDSWDQVSKEAKEEFKKHIKLVDLDK